MNLRLKLAVEENQHAYDVGMALHFETVDHAVAGGCARIDSPGKTEERPCSWLEVDPSGRLNSKMAAVLGEPFDNLGHCGLHLLA